MKFLLDHQMPPRLKLFFHRKGYEAIHDSEIGLETQTDRVIWQYAQLNGLYLVSKDVDFFYLASRDPSGPRFIWVRVGNCSSATLIDAFERLWPQIEAWSVTADPVVEVR